MGIINDIEDNNLPLPSPKEMEELYNKKMQPLAEETFVDYDKDVQEDLKMLRRTYSGKAYTIDNAEGVRLALERKYPKIKSRLIKNRDNTESLVFASKQTDRQELGVLYNFLKSKIPNIQVKKITEDEALALSGKRDARAFIKGDTIYFVEGKVNDLVMMEEFFHPFIEALFQKNRPVFDSLLAEAKELYPNLNQATKNSFPALSEEDHKKETLTKALSKAFKKDYDDNGIVNFESLRFRLSKLVTKFFSWMSEFFTDGKIRAKSLQQGVTLKDLAMMINAKGTTLDAEFTDKIMFNAPPADVSAAAKTLSQLEAISNNVTMSPDEKSYIVSGESFSRLTEWVRNKIVGKTKTTQDFVDSQVDWYFKNHKIEMIDGVEFVIDEDGKKVNRTQLAEDKLRKMNTGTALGRVIHGLIDKYIKEANGLPTDELSERIKKDAKGKLDQDEIDVSSLDWLDFTLTRTLKDLGITTFEKKVKKESRDKLITESYLKSDILKVATTADGVVVHQDGGISIIDWKTGKKFITSMGYSKLLNDIASYTNDISNSKLDIAKLEVVLRALMIKENMPDSHFRMLKIAHLSKFNNTYFDINLDDYLKVINDYFLNNDKATHKLLSDKGLLNGAKYGTSDRILTDADAESIQKKIANIDNKIVEIRNSLLNTQSKKEVIRLEELLQEYSKKRLELEYGSSVDLVGTETEDIGWMKKWFGNYYSVSNRLVQMFGRMFFKAKQKFNERKADFTREFNKKQQALTDEWKAKNPGLRSITVPYYNDEGTGLYNFLWVKRSQAGVEGYYKVKPLDPEYAALTPIQKDYITYMNRMIAETYKNNTSRKLDEFGSTYATMLGLPEVLDESFMPRVPMQKEEYFERYKLNDPRLLDSRMDTINKIFNKDVYKYQELGSIPIKYMENSNIIGQQAHSFNAELAFKMYMEHMMFREEMDSIFSLGKGVVFMLKASPHKLENTIEFLENRIAMDILNQKAATKFMRKDMKVLGRTINTDNTLDAMRRLVSKSTMILKPVSGTRNMLLITYLNWKKGAIGSIAKRSGVPESQIDFTGSDIISAYGEVIKSRFENMFSKDKSFQDTKLALILRNIDYRQDNMDYYNSKDSLISAKLKEINVGGVKISIPSSKYLYFFHKLGEDLGTDSLLIAQLKRMKNHKTGKSMWDSYIVVNGELKWDGGDRGVSVSGEIIKGLTSDEITKLKRASQMIHGSYRDEEKMAIEMYALGRWAIMFKKYLPVLMENLYQGYYEDASIGSYDIVEGEGKDLMIWKSQINEGRVRTLLKVMAYWSKAKNGNAAYSWENLTPKQKQDMIDLGTTVSIFITLATAAMLYFDDDDEEEWIFTQAWRMINDTTQGLWPGDFLGATKEPATVHVKFLKIMGSISEFFIDGVIKGEKTAKGDMKGWTNFEKVTPGLSWLYELEKLMDNDKLDREFFRDR
jgi:hypothetical protein